MLRWSLNTGLMVFSCTHTPSSGESCFQIGKAKLCLSLRSLAYLYAVFYADVALAKPINMQTRRLKGQMRRIRGFDKLIRRRLLLKLRKKLKLKLQEKLESAKMGSISSNQSLQIWTISKNKIQLLYQLFSAKMEV